MFHRSLIFPRAEKRPIGSALELVAKSFHAPVVDEKGQTRFGAQFARSMIAKDENDVTANRPGLFRRDKKIQGRGEAIPARTHFSTYGNIESFDFSAAALFHCWRQRNVLSLGVGAGFFASGNRYVERSRQIRVGRVSHEHLSEFPDYRGGIKKLIRRESGHRAANHITNIVHTGLERDEPDAVYALPDLRHVIDGEPAQLDLLPGCNIRKALAELAADFGERAQLGCGRDAVGNTHAHHKMTRRLAAEKDPGPFKPLLVAFSDGFPPFRGVTRNVLEDIQPIFFLFVFFDLVHLQLTTIDSLACS